MDVEQRTVTLLHLNEIVVVAGNKSPKKQQIHLLTGIFVLKNQVF